MEVAKQQSIWRDIRTSYNKTKRWWTHCNLRIHEKISLLFFSLRRVFFCVVVEGWRDAEISFKIKTLPVDYIVEWRRQLHTMLKSKISEAKPTRLFALSIYPPPFSLWFWVVLGNRNICMHGMCLRYVDKLFHGAQERGLRVCEMGGSQGWNGWSQK